MFQCSVILLISQSWPWNFNVLCRYLTKHHVPVHWNSTPLLLVRLFPIFITLTLPPQNGHGLSSSSISFSFVCSWHQPVIYLLVYTQLSSSSPTAARIRTTRTRSRWASIRWVSASNSVLCETVFCSGVSYQSLTHLIISSIILHSWSTKTLRLLNSHLGSLSLHPQCLHCQRRGLKNSMWLCLCAIIWTPVFVVTGPLPPTLPRR